MNTTPTPTPDPSVAATPAHLMTPPPSAAGLAGVVAAETVLSRVDGELGQLVLRGRDLEALAGRSFEAVVSLLWTGGEVETASFTGALGAARARASARVPELRAALSVTDGMDALRAALAHGVAVPADEPAPADERQALDLEILGASAVYAAAWWRLRQSLDPLASAPGLGHAADYLHMLGQDASSGEGRARARALDAYLLTVIDHGLNASTFTARVVASTWSDPTSAVVAAICALKGPLHGGAPGPVLDMLDSVKDFEGGADAWVRRELDAGRRVMGMGHRVYRVRDPRAAVLEGAATELGAPRLALAREVEASAQRVLQERKPGRRLAANVEFYTAILLEAIGLDRLQFSPTFAVGRAAGWLAHAREQRDHGRLIRPRARYVGPEPRGAKAGSAGGASPESTPGGAA